MIDLAVVRERLSRVQRDEDEVPVTKRFLEQLIAELDAGRSAMASTGAMFGLGEGVTL